MERSLFIYHVLDINGRVPVKASEYNSSYLYIPLLQSILADEITIELLKQ